MNRREHLLTCLAEECSEVAQRVSKALRFGLEEIQPGQLLTNEARIRQELQDLIAVATLLEDEGAIQSFYPTGAMIENKLNKIERLFSISRRMGTLD